jgi:hypothetical protein
MSKYLPEVARVNAAAARQWGRSAVLGLGVLALGAGAAASLAGCSAPSVNVASDPVAAVRNAAAASSGIHTAKVATSVTMTVGSADRHFTGLGEFDFDRKVGAIILQTQQSPTPLDEIITPTTLYLRQAGTNAKWRWVDATKLPDGDLISAGYTSPVFDFALLRGVNGDGVHFVGQDTVRNTPVAHYTGTLDLTASAQQAQSPIKDELLSAAHSFSQRTVPFDAYLDAQNKLRRVVAHFSFPAEAPQHGLVQIAATTDLFDLDKPVTVVTPPAKDVAVTAPSTSAH